MIWSLRVVERGEKLESSTLHINSIERNQKMDGPISAFFATSFTIIYFLYCNQIIIAFSDYITQTVVCLFLKHQLPF